MNLLPQKLSSGQKKLLSLIGIVIVVLILTWVWTSLSSSQYLRTTASLGDNQAVDETVSSSGWHTFQSPAVPLSFEVPVEWKTEVANINGVDKYIDLKNIKIWFYESEEDSNTIITQLLGVSTRDLITYPAKLGTTSGTMWAKANVVEETKAPIGSRVYIPDTKNGLAIVLLPAPPYSDVQLRIINSLASR